MEPTNGVETVKTYGEVTNGVSYPLPQELAVEEVSDNFSHDGRFVQYCINGIIFEVTAKYKSLAILTGRGAFGIACSATNSETNEKVAIKKTMHTFDNNMEAKRTLREIKILRHLNHENVIGIKDLILPPQRHLYEDVYIVYDLMDFDLYEVLRSNQELQQDHIKYVLYQILCGLRYIHSANVVHRDLKPGNLHLSRNWDLKISDFGLARVIPESHFMTDYVVPRWYRAPELVLEYSNYTSAVDVWSVGCIFMEIVNRKPLFPGNDQVHQLRLIMELIGTPSEEELGALHEPAKQYMRQVPLFPRQSFSEKFPKLPPLAVDLMEKMLKFDHRQRISVDEALAHPYLEWYRGYKDESVCMVPLNFEELEQHQFTVEQIKELIHCEALAFNP